MHTTNEQQEIQQMLQELNAASAAFDVADLVLKRAERSTAPDDTLQIALAERSQAVARYVAAKEWLYAHTDGVLYDSSTNAFKLRNFHAASWL